MSKNLKQFTMEKKEDYLFVLEDLYINVYCNLKKYRRYNDELLDICMSNVHLKDDKIVSENLIPIDIYEDINDRIGNISKKLILYISDDSSDSMSYRMFRRIFNKTNNLDLKLEDDKILDGQLQELLNLRNWIFHNPQSRLVSMKEVYKNEKERIEKEYLNNFPEEIRGFLKPHKDYGIINIPFPQYCKLEYLVSLYLETDRRIIIYEDILNKMKLDYSKILGKEVTVIESIDKNPIKLKDSHLAITNLSMAIQKRKYKGDNEELYNEVTLKDFRYDNDK